jgi:hypothetical protein
VRGSSGGRLPVPDWLSEVVPDWLADVMGPKQTLVPWADMARAVFAIWVPLAVGFATGRRDIALLPAPTSVTDAVRSVLAVLTRGGESGARGSAARQPAPA